MNKALPPNEIEEDTARLLQRAAAACERLREREQRYRSLVQYHPDAVYSLAPDGIVVAVNPSGEQITGYAAGEAVRIHFHRLVHPDSRERADRCFAEALQGHSQSCDIVLVHKDGHVIETQFTHIPIIVNGKVTGVFGIARDLTRHRRAEAAISQLAYFDPLTNLPNRTLFYARLEAAVDAAAEHTKKLAVLTLDLNRFKVINDTLGTSVGDRLLATVAERLTRSVRDHDTVARTGGDEFSILLLNVHSRDDVLLLADRVRSVLEAVTIIDEYELFMAPSIGVTLYPDDGADAATLLENADTALHDAKSRGSGHIQVYQREMTHAALERLQLENELRKALEREEFIVYYQPRVDLVSGRVIGVEALLRWNHHRLGMVSPAEFIPLAEESGLIVPIGEWVLCTACAQARAWTDAGLDPIVMAVNLSARQFHQSRVLATVSDALSSTGLDPKRLELEITESIIMQNEAATSATLHELRASGVRISIDDFGTGYSSLTYLKRFPIDSIKIDQSFVCDIADSRGDQAIAVAVISLAHSLSLRVVAEGVETVDQLRFLQSKACDEMQGFLYSRPVPAAECTELLRGQLKPAVDLLSIEAPAPAVSE